MVVICYFHLGYRQLELKILRCLRKNRSYRLTTVEERENTERLIIRNLQGKVFQDESSEERNSLTISQ